MTDTQTLPAPPEQTRLALLKRWWGGHPVSQAIGLVIAAAVLAIAASPPTKSSPTRIPA